MINEPPSPSTRSFHPHRLLLVLTTACGHFLPLCIQAFDIVDSLCTFSPPGGNGSRTKRMLLRSPATQAAVALGWLLSFVAAQGYFGPFEAQTGTCPGDGFVRLGCFINTAITASFTYEPINYIGALDPSLSFPEFWPLSDRRGGIPQISIRYNNTVTPYSCSRACRGHGFKYTALDGGNCRCGNLFPEAASNPSPGATGPCTTPCGGDASQFCGGGGATEVYLDTTYTDPGQLPTALILAGQYEYLGCYYVGPVSPLTAVGSPTWVTGIPNTATGLNNVDTSISACFLRCATAQLPMAFAIPQ